VQTLTGLSTWATGFGDSALMRNFFAIIGGLAALAVVPAVVLSASGVFGSSLDRQSARWTTTSATTSMTNWRNVPRLALTHCTLNRGVRDLLYQRGEQGCP
jgi:hypothetical protein